MKQFSTIFDGRGMAKTPPPGVPGGRIVVNGVEPAAPMPNAAAAPDAADDPPPDDPSPNRLEATSPPDWTAEARLTVS